MGIPIRGEKWELTYAPEATYGTAVATAYLTRVMGVVQSATIPDPNVEFTPVYTLGTASNRNWYAAYKGKIALSGGVPDIMLLNGTPLYLPIGTVATTGTDDGTGGSDLDGATAIGDTSFDVTDSTGYATDDYIQVDLTTKAEVRKITNVSSNTITVDYPLSFAHADAATCNEVTSPYTHTISETTTLRSITEHVEIQDADGNSELMRRYAGGKCNRATISASEGEILKMGVDELVFNTYAHDISGETGYDSGIAAVTPSYPTTEVYLFSTGAISLFDSEVARIRAFNLSIDNAIEPKYYVSDDGTAQCPYEVREGRRTYTLAISVDVEDNTMFTELIRQGTYSSVFKGFTVSAVFTRGASDTITITLPPSAPAAGGDAMGCLIKTAPHNIAQDALQGVELEIIARSCSVVIVDSEYLYPC
jgi:hypothetical protein